jgi:hypothetical protein
MAIRTLKASRSLPRHILLQSPHFALALETNPKANSVALMNLLEAMLNLEYLYLRHTSSRTTRAPPGAKDYGYHGHAPLVGFTAATMTWSKTGLYFIQGEPSLHSTTAALSVLRAALLRWVRPQGSARQ